ncbi:MAG: hypothetical protein BWY71_01393 [Planctomycetes bacterium ADurb.Bin412]|nr:MAG: hypothetical protein BWY71_01393 [Planctomycetes bacterium ADurb.Bin412]
MLGDPFPAFRVRKFQQAAAGAAVHPVRMIFRDPGPAGHPFRLEPHHGSHAPGTGKITDLLNPVGETDWIRFPRPGLGPAGSIARIPAGILPPDIDVDFLVRMPLDKFHLLRCHRHQRGKIVPAAQRHLRLQQFAPRLRQAVMVHPAPPEILPPQPAALVKLQHHQRAAHLLAGQQFEMRQFLPAANLQVESSVTDKAGVPLPGPTEHVDQAFPAKLNIVIRKRNLGRPSAGIGDGAAAARGQRFQQRLVAVGGTIVPLNCAQHKFPCRAAAEIAVHRLDILQDGRIRGPGVLEVQRPLHRRIILIFHRLAANLQPGLGFGILQRISGPPLVQLFHIPLEFPVIQHLAGRLPVIYKRERCFHRIGLLLGVDYLHIPQPEFLPVRQRNFCFRPTGLVAVDIVTGIIDRQGEFGRPLQVRLQRFGRLPAQLHLRAAQLPPFGFHDKNHAPAAVVPIGVDPHLRGKRFPRTGQLHQVLGGGMAVDPPVVALVRDAQRLPLSGVLLQGAAVIGQHHQPLATRRIERYPLKFGRNPLRSFRQFIRSSRQGQNHFRRQKHTQKSRQNRPFLPHRFFLSLK